MDDTKNENNREDSASRELIVAYLSYALDDVRAMSADGLQFLQLAIATIAQDCPEQASHRASLASWH